jgi:hypothetical protein
VPAGVRADAARPSKSVELVDEDDRRRLLTRLLEQVAHAGGADADEHLDELGPGDGEERHLGLARDGLGEERLAGAGRTDEQDAFRHAPAETAVFVRVLEEVDDLAQLVLRLVDPRHVLEGHAGVGLDVDLGLRLADGHEASGAAEPLRHAASEIGPYAEEEQHGQDPGQEIAEEGALDLARVADVEFLELVGEFGVDAGRHEPALALERLPEFALDEAVGDGDLRDLAVAQQLLELAVGDVRDLLGRRVDVLHEQQSEEGRDPVADVELRLLVHGPAPLFAEITGAATGSSVS